MPCDKERQLEYFVKAQYYPKKATSHANPRSIILIFQEATDHSSLKNSSWSKSKIFTSYHYYNYLPDQTILQRHGIQSATALSGYFDNSYAIVYPSHPEYVAPESPL